MKVRVNAYGLDQTDVRCHAVVASALFLSLLSSVGTGFFVFSLAEVLLMLAFFAVLKGMKKMMCRWTSLNQNYCLSLYLN